MRLKDKEGKILISISLFPKSLEMSSLSLSQKKHLEKKNVIVAAFAAFISGHFFKARRRRRPIHYHYLPFWYFFTCREFLMQKMKRCNLASRLMHKRATAIFFSYFLRKSVKSSLRCKKKKSPPVRNCFEQKSRSGKCI